MQTSFTFCVVLCACMFGHTFSANCLLAQTNDAKSTNAIVYVAKKDATEIEKFDYQRYFTTDKFKRSITFYLSKPSPVLNGKILPLVVCIQGSGSQSIFLKVGTPGGKRVVSGGPESVVRRAFRDDVRVLVVEKPGVEFLVQPSQPGSAEEGSEEYNREFSFERWVEAIHASTSCVLQMPDIDPSRVLALGHSEGGQVACQLAAINSKVTHVATMAGGGPSQLYDFLVMAKSGEIYDPSATADQRVAALLSDWQKVLDEPQATDKFILGHSHLRWSSFLKSSPIDAILKSNAKVFIAQGSKDTNSLPASADVLYAELMARGRDVVYERVDGGDHGFMTDGDGGAGWHTTNKKAINWFLRD